VFGESYKCSWICILFVDSVEEGEKLVQTALENFGRIG